MVWNTTDVDFSEAFRYVPFPGDHPDFAVYELATGPMNSGIFPNRRVDPTLNPEVLSFYGPELPTDVQSWQQAKRWFNFGTLEVDAAGKLTARVINTAGKPKFSLSLLPNYPAGGGGPAVSF